MDKTRSKWLEEVDKGLFIVGFFTPFISIVALMDVLGLSIWLKAGILGYIITGLGAVYIANLFPRINQNGLVCASVMFGISVIWPIWMIAKRKAVEPGVIKTSIQVMVAGLGIMVLCIYCLASLLSALS
ncbi:MAG: hypothetical protein C9356_14845 [Oleiphilus sp.]|nr:MAG: hypothetical protein C9356_14845 [Oleiphilus sp.]